MDYERGIKAAERLSTEQEYQVALARLVHNLRDVIRREGLFGTNEMVRSEKAGCVYELNALTHATGGVYFTDLCIGKEPPR